MPDFRTLYEQKKWNEISGMEQAALTRMSSGEATVDDLRAIQHLIAQYQNLVSSTFRSGLRALSVAAEQRVQKIAEDRAAKGKPELTEEQFSKLLGLALDKAWFEQGPEIAVLLEAELEKSRTTQNKEFENLLDRKFADYKPRKDEDSHTVEIIPTETKTKENHDVVVVEVSPVEEEPVSPVEERSEPKGPTVNLARFLADTGIEDLLDRKFREYAPKEPAQELRDLGTQLVEQQEEQREPTLLEQKVVEQKDEVNVPLSDQLIEQANKSADVTQDLEEELKDITNPDKRDDREDSKIKKWWRAFKSKMPNLRGKTRGLASGLAILLGKLLVTELMGGKLWSEIQEYFSWENIKKVASEMADVASSLMDRGWKALSEYMSFEKVNKLLKQALVWGLDGLGSIGSSIKSFFGFEDEIDPKAKTTIPGPGQTSENLSPEINKKLAELPKYDSDVPQVDAKGNVQPTVAERYKELTSTIGSGASGSWGDDVPVTVPGPGKETEDKIAPTGPVEIDLNPASESQLVKEPLLAKGATVTPEAATKPEDKVITLGDQNQNEIPETKPQPKPTGTQQLSKATGGVQSSMAGFSRGVSVDGTLTVLNFGMLTS